MQARSSFPPSKLPVAGSRWPSGTTDLDGQLTENSEEALNLSIHQNQNTRAPANFPAAFSFLNLSLQ